MTRERLVSGKAAGVEQQEAYNYALRPGRFGEYVGQPNLIRKLRIAVGAATARGEPVDHALLHGPPGLGKTTLAHVIAHEAGAKVHVTSGPALTKAADLAGLLSRLEPRDVLFIDEIHRLSAVVEEYLYPAMEDFKIDLTLDAGAQARVMTVPLRPFTLIGATTRLGLLSGAMRGRFGIVEHLEFYSPDELLTILRANAAKLDVSHETGALEELAARSRGTPRVANRLLRRVRDFAAIEADGVLSREVTRRSLELEEIDPKGLDALDRAFLRTIVDFYAGGPVGIEAVAASMGEERDTLEDVIEPFLLQNGFVTRTRQGRRVTKLAYDHLGLRWNPEQHDADLFR